MRRLWLSHWCSSHHLELQVCRACFSLCMFAVNQPLVPLETDSGTLQLQIHPAPSLYLMKGKSGNLLLMNLECKKNKSPSLLESA